MDRAQDIVLVHGTPRVERVAGDGALSRFKLGRGVDAFAIEEVGVVVGVFGIGIFVFVLVGQGSRVREVVVVVFV
jgi:hypothetical protein